MHRNINFEDIEFLIDVTHNYMKENNLCDLSGSYGSNSHFYLIVRRFFPLLNAEKASFNLYIKWNRNDNLFRTKVLQKLNLKSDFSLNKFELNDYSKPMRIVFDSNEWKEILKFTSNNSRPLLLAGSNKIFTKKFSICGLKCLFKLKFNRFRTTKKEIPGHNYWHGKFKCKICKQEVESFIDKSPGDSAHVIMNLELKKNCSGLNGKIRIDGEQREKIKQEAFCKGTLNFKNEAFLKNDQIKMGIKDPTIRKMRSEFAHRFQMDKEFRVDCDKTKFFFDLECPGYNKKSIQGYVHEVRSNPFGAILLSEFQVKIWAIIFERDPIWYFDATGGMFKNILHQQETLVYSIVVHDSLHKKCLSIADFLTNSNTNVSIYTYLYVILEKCKCYRFFKLPKAIVSDYSWANINALMKAVNNLDVLDYLNLAYQIVVQNQIYAVSGIKTMIYLCSTHFLKNIQDDTKKALKYIDDDKAKKLSNFFIGCFGLLQNSMCLDVFCHLLRSIKIVFSSKYENNLFVKNYATLKAYLLNNTIEIINHTCANCKVPKKGSNEYEKNKAKKFIFIENQNVSYVKDSQFTDYFEEYLTYIEENDVSSINLYYMPKLFEIIKKRLHIMPLWSGILFKYFDISETRLSNNYVEKSFQDMKINITNRNKRVNKYQKLGPGDFITPHYFNLKYVFNRFYEDQFNIKYFDFESKRENYQIDRFSYEKWSFPKQSKKYKFDSIIDFESLESNQIRDLIKKIKLVDIGIYDYMEIENNNKIDSVEKTESENDKTDSDEKTESENEKMETTEKLKFEDVYDSETQLDNFFYYKIGENQLRKIDVANLLNCEWLSEHVLEAYAVCLLKKSKEKIMILNSFHSTEIFNNGCLRVEVDYEFSRYKKIFGFINENSIHWTCFLINIEECSIFYLDPKGEKELNKNNLIKSWTNFSQSVPYFSKKKWKLGKLSHSIQTDSNNCGVYVCRFLKLLLEGKELFFDNSSDNLAKFRQEMNYTLKINSSKTFCSFCGLDLGIEDETLTTNCFHRYHSECPGVKLKTKTDFFCPICF